MKVEKPYERYTEVFIDEGENDMFAVMKELVRQKYTRLIYPEHPRGIDYDRERPNFRPQYPGGGGYAAFAFNVGYTRAMMQAALAVEAAEGRDLMSAALEARRRCVPEDGAATACDMRAMNDAAASLDRDCGRFGSGEATRVDALALGRTSTQFQALRPEDHRPARARDRRARR